MDKLVTRGYIPTIDGEPGRFDGYQICFCCRSYPAKLEPSLRIVRRQITRTINNRTRDGMLGADTRYGVLRVVG
jgi:hypothetical protein